MSLDEIKRYKESFIRKYEREQKKELSQIYILADLIGLSNARIHIKNATYPALNELFPKLFTEEEIIDEDLEEQKAVAWIYKFANSYNNKHKGE